MLVSKNKPNSSFIYFLQFSSRTLIAGKPGLWTAIEMWYNKWHVNILISKGSTFLMRFKTATCWHTFLQILATCLSNFNISPIVSPSICSASWFGMMLFSQRNSGLTFNHHHSLVFEQIKSKVIQLKWRRYSSAKFRKCTDTTTTTTIQTSVTFCDFAKFEMLLASG